MRRFLFLAFVVVVVGCGGNVADDGASDAGTDAETAVHSPSTCASRPSQDCRRGAVGGACEDEKLVRVCTAEGWVCPPGTVPGDQCGCSTDGLGGPPIDAGQPCTYPTEDAAAIDAASSETGSSCAIGEACSKEGATCTTEPPCHYPPSIICTCTSGVWSCPPACI